MGVPGEGPSAARIMIIGQSPGPREDVVGKPFVGPAGKYLDSALEETGLLRREMFVTSVLKHYLPSGASVRREYLRACLPYTLRQIILIKPRLILLLGAVAARGILGAREFRKVRGAWLQAYGARCMATHHPAAAMRFRKSAVVLARDLHRFALAARERSSISGRLRA